ncbi:MAG: NAD(P)H-hydrate dehydratase [Armatimonadetes bacterium]|nr:NAD(P)H-hydrate dehydratase [Armatimonadota bacterium]NIM22854.1 NAD(P)H-hydrate dehydratase [Armatimonadota bacterium]NIM66720.1 NAD(P)H-hydrate dehydratase [Armatimonadota bacterium]NIM75277.1 NAD(P)H-hydrate dehydratase [Armatimonadota bacterium]NIN04917.1 NAD(P)H-hydrate dehydratase [Armatimonadota bacterium]
MKIVTSEQMNALDRAAQEAGVSIMELMENAGRAVFEKAEAMLGTPQGRRVAIICGKGNNGGDGLVAARYLKKWGAGVEVLLACSASDLKGAPKANYGSALQAGVPVEENAQADRVLGACEQADLVIDALLGTGIKGAVERSAAEIISAVNRANRPVLAVDIPSGIQADTGEIAGVAVHANHTVTVGLPKWGLLNFPGAEYAGRVVVADIGIPAAAIEAMSITAEYLDAAEVAHLLPRRSPAAHKGDCGRALVIAGSAGYTGAAALCSMGALRMGAGLVTLAVPASLNDVMEAKLTEVITRPMPETAARSLSKEAQQEILELAARSDVVAMGPGLSLEPETALLVRRLVGRLAIPVVLDADALTALSTDIDLLKGAQAPIVCTPHPGEMARLVNLSPAEVQKARASTAQSLARSIEGVVVLKGAATLIADAEDRLRVNRTGNAGMASGGTGDVLTGMIAGLLAQGMSPFDAASVGTYLHGLAGDLAAAEKGDMGLIASDLLEKVPDATIYVSEVVRQSQ